MSNIHGLGSAPKKDAKDPNLEEFSVGGHKSSTAVYRPTNSANRDIIERAKNQNISPDQAPSSGAMITIYANGFVIGDGEFQDMKVPENAKFLEDLKKGFVPRSLERTIREQFPDAQQVGVSLVDKSQEHFDPPPPKFSFENSVGMSLGSSKAVAAADFSSASPQPISVDPSQPTVTVQLVFHNRKRVRQTFNAHHTVLDVYQHIMAETGKDSFNMVTGFPPKPLKDPSATVKDAKLNGSSVEQRLV